MNFFIPEIGTLIRLEEDWTFTLYNERRNDSLMKFYMKRLIPKDDNNISLQNIRQNLKNQIVELPKGLVIKIDRIYIRKGLSQYSSISFTIPNPKSKKDKKEMPHNLEFGGTKFWAKLHECNGLNFSTVLKNEETKELFTSLYKEIEKDASNKFGLEKCTKMMIQINKLLGPGQNINNFSSDLRYDQFLNNILFKIKDDSFLSDYLYKWIKSEMREYKIKQLI